MDQSWTEQAHCECNRRGVEPYRHGGGCPVYEEWALTLAERAQTEVDDVTAACAACTPEETCTYHLGYAAGTIAAHLTHARRDVPSSS